MAERIQRKRTKGWTMPDNTVYVGRPSKWGNLWPVEDKNYEQAVRLYNASVVRKGDGFKVEVRRELRGKHLACSCPLDQPCHADILLKIANG